MQARLNNFLWEVNWVNKWIIFFCLSVISVWTFLFLLVICLLLFAQLNPCCAVQLIMPLVLRIINICSVYSSMHRYNDHEATISVYCFPYLIKCSWLPSFVAVNEKSSKSRAKGNVIDCVTRTFQFQVLCRFVLTCTALLTHHHVKSF
jgi:hypothetical protein